MIGDSKYETLEWEIKDDIVEIRDKKTKEVVTTEELGAMVDYAFRHTVFTEYDNCTWNKYCPDNPSACGFFSDKGCTKK